MTTLNDTIMTERGRDMKRCILVDRIKLYGGKVEKKGKNTYSIIKSIYS